MARDYRHGHSHKQAFQRKSQQKSQEKEVRSTSFIWGVGILISVILVLGFFVVSHFFVQGTTFLETTSQSIFQSSTEPKKEPETSPKTSVVQLAEPKPLQPALIVTEVVVPERAGEPERTSSKNSNQHYYSFYQGLSQTEVVVEAELISVALTQPYYIQAGSFGSEKIAKQEQRRLAKHGQTLTVSALTNGNRTYYRLRVGPFKDRLVMNKQRNELRRLGVDTLLIKAPK